MYFLNYVKNFVVFSSLHNCKTASITQYMAYLSLVFQFSLPRYKSISRMTSEPAPTHAEPPPLRRKIPLKPRG
ncbi:AI-2E family transporter [Acetobacter orientalis]|uniref:AI-2E family transporter n=1 Tax=Acetobacter orientalis TaxID=146474 RepID=A0A2Z5ZLY9_9PROT|nr:AI-2E family transporter [Acetobacter orientalis]